MRMLWGTALLTACLAAGASAGVQDWLGMGAKAQPAPPRQAQQSPSEHGTRGAWTYDLQYLDKPSAEQRGTMIATAPAQSADGPDLVLRCSNHHFYVSLTSDHRLHDLRELVLRTNAPLPGPVLRVRKGSRAWVGDATVTADFAEYTISSAKEIDIRLVREDGTAHDYVYKFETPNTSGGDPYNTNVSSLAAGKELLFYGPMCPPLATPWDAADAGDDAAPDGDDPSGHHGHHHPKNVQNKTIAPPDADDSSDRRGRPPRGQSQNQTIAPPHYSSLTQDGTALRDPPPAGH